MNLQMAQWMISHPLKVGLITPYAQSNLLRHRPTGKEHRRFLPGQLCKTVLEILNNLSFAIDIAIQLRVQLLQRFGKYTKLPVMMAAERVRRLTIGFS
ncbi:hypothetical protein D1872_299720 [compost metagenome]